jgi:rhodanese-related sulfurtransferase
MTSAVTQTPAASSQIAIEHFESEFTFETDCWDVHDFVLLDVRSHDLYAKGHIRGAISMPHGKIVESLLSRWSQDTLFVTYCAGPHCNGASKAALRLAKLGRPVKIMTGGITGWLDEGFILDIGVE